jgi:hypothetical protein
MTVTLQGSPFKTDSGSLVQIIVIAQIIIFQDRIYYLATIATEGLFIMVHDMKTAIFTTVIAGCFYRIDHFFRHKCENRKLLPKIKVILTGEPGD